MTSGLEVKLMNVFLLEVFLEDEAREEKQMDALNEWPFLEEEKKLAAELDIDRVYWDNPMKRGLYQRQEDCIAVGKRLDQAHPQTDFVGLSYLVSVGTNN